MKKLFATILSFLGVLSLTGCNQNYLIDDNATTITVAASPTPHAQILNECVDLMADKGYTLIVKEFTDYVLPNTATQDGSVQANYFQHTPYLDEFNQFNGTNLVSVGKVHYEPFGIYAGTYSSLENLPKGSKIVVPNDGTNEARALLLLQQAGLITLNDGIGLSATKLDIKDSNGYQIIEAEAAAIASLRQDAALVVLNGNYALSNNLKVTDALEIEDATSLAAKTYANILVVRDGNQEKPIVKALYDCLTSSEIKSYIEQTYSGSVIPLS